jgi:hypothetical protein
MWAGKIQNIQVRRIDGNDLDFLNLNLNLHLAKYFQILLEGVFEFKIILADDDPDNLEDYEININYLANNNDAVFDVLQFTHWLQMTLYRELIHEKTNLLNDTDNEDYNKENIGYLNEVIAVLADEFKDAESFDNLMDSIAMNLFYD